MTKHIQYTAPDLAQIKARVFEKTPILQETVEKLGKKSLFEYAKSYPENHLSSQALARRQELITIVSVRAEQLFDQTTAQSIARQLGKYFFVSTADHHGPICHPFWLNANLLAATQASTLENILVFSCATVSLNNSSVPRGLIFHSDAKNYEQLHQLSFFPASENQRPVFGMRAYIKTDLARLKKNIWSKVQDESVRMAVAEKIIKLIDEVYGAAEAFAAPNFSSQISVTNAKLWQRFFPVNQTVPRLIYLDQESITTELLLSHHLTADTIISQMILDTSLAPMIVKYFDGIRGGFSLAEKKGSYLFWALPAGSKYRQQLWLDGKELRTTDGAFCVPLEADAIMEKLQTGELIPTILLTFLILSFYYGLKCLGGFLQPSYLTATKTAYIRMLKELGLISEIEAFSATDTKTMGGDFALAFLQDKHKKLHQATGLDLLLYSDGKAWETFQTLTKQVSLEDSVTVMLPLFYEVLYREEERDKGLAGLRTNEIMQLSGLDKKIKPCAFM